MAEVWRLLESGPAAGAENMALDAAILMLQAEGASPATLHVYDWMPPAISIGRMQRLERVVDVERCSEDGIDVVRRPTGGRAILHRDDFTFSILASGGGVIPFGVKASHAVLAGVTRRALAALGLASDTGTARRPSSRNACFASSTIADLTCKGRKIVGGAQRWEGTALLQQNSLLLRRRASFTHRYILPGEGQTVEEADRALGDGVCSLEEELGFVPARAHLIESLSEALVSVLGAKVEAGGAKAEEIRLAGQMLARHALVTSTRHPR